MRQQISNLLRRFVPISLAAFALATVACNDSTGAGSGTLTMQLTDAPFPYDSVASADIWIVRIDGKTQTASDADVGENEDDDTNGGNANPSQGWVTLATPNQSYDLLALQNGTTVNLGQATLPTGNYRGFRLILDTDKSSITLKDGTVLTGISNPGIKFPSAAKTGVKIVLQDAINITEGGTVMVVDFDLGSSFVMRGNSVSQNGLLFKPVIRGTARDITGGISGNVTSTTADGDAVADATVEVLRNGTALNDTVSANVISTGKTDAAGNYSIVFLNAGTYAVRATPPATLTTLNPAILQGIIVAEGQTTTGTNIILP